MAINVHNIEGTPASTFAVTIGANDSDEVYEIPAADRVSDDGRHAQAATITVESAGGCRIAFGATSPTVSVGHFMDNGDILRLTNPGAIRSCKFTRGDVTKALKLQISMEY